MDASPFRAVIKIGACARSRKTVVWRYLDMHIVNYCQLDCKHCYLVKGHDTMPFGMFKDICEDFMAVRHPLKDIDIILGGGDALLHPEFNRIVGFLREKRLPVRMSSNGILIPDFISLFDKADSVQISIDGNEDVHDFIRGRGVYNRAVQALHMLNDASIPHSIAFTACKENIHCINSILDICRETCVSHLNISKLQPDNVTALSPISFSEWKQLKARARNEAPDVTIPSVCRETGCIGGVLGLSVLPDGTYWDCALNQEVVGRYPSSIRDLLYWEYIRAGTARDPFETCLRGEACVRYS